jgi:SecD/SecF fusion protein
MFGLYAVKVPDGGKAIINGEHIETAGAGASEVTGQPIITIKMTDPGAHDWEIMTRKNIGRAIAITLDNQVLSCPLVYDVIKGGSTEISGTFTKEEAEELAARIYKGKKK